MKAWTRRDLTIVPMGQHSMVVACDSCGGVGIKDGDILKLSPRHVAKFTTRVALTEVLCSGAMPVMITNGVACEMNPTGAKMILGIKEELENAGIKDIALSGSTEENFPTSMTALAVTVIGMGSENDLKFGHAVKGDKLILLGTPRVGDEVDLESNGFYEEIKHLRPIPEVREIVPVGSKGVAYEAEGLASLSGMNCELYKTGIDYSKSAGPVTCLLVLCDRAIVDYVLNSHPTGTVIGEIHRA
ncbi:MAG: alpha-ribazole-5-phosphate synthase [Defluviitaleaceae bacterium]|nr:alpha-ribazole-5-phosphate synthase [Defluviitaleaceae bacterium]